jgi:dephospho-CoA kinase
LDGLNSIIHPKVHHCFNQWKSTQDAAYLIYEAAIIFEHGSENQFDYTILVVADREEKIKRVMSRDSVTKKEVEGRMKNQWDDQKKLKKADFVIENNSLVKATLKVEEIHKNLSG